MFNPQQIIKEVEHVTVYNYYKIICFRNMCNAWNYINHGQLALLILRMATKNSIIINEEKKRQLKNEKKGMKFIHLLQTKRLL